MVLAGTLLVGAVPMTIKQPSPMTSFDWSDFPLVHEFNPADEHQASVVAPSSPCLQFHEPRCSTSTKGSFVAVAGTRLPAATTPWNTSGCSPSVASPSSTTSSTATANSASTSTTGSMSSLEDDSDDSINSHCRRRHRLVTFSPCVQVREYNLVVGDHPSCNLPLSLGWNYTDGCCDSTSLPLQEYNNDNGFHRRHRRFASQLRTTFAERKHKLLTIGGYTEQELWQLLVGLQQEQQHHEHEPSLSTTTTNNNTISFKTLKHVRTATSLLVQSCS